MLLNPSTKEWRDAAEADLIDLVRRNDAQNFRVTITCLGGRWTVETIDNDNPDPRLTTVGRGETFADAWHGQDPAWAREGD